MNVHFNKDEYFPYQWDFLTSTKAINGLCGGFGSGKTHVFLRKTLYNLLTKRKEGGKSNGWIIYPTLMLADELFVEPFKELLESVNLKYKYNQSTHKFITPIGSVKIYQLQRPQRIIGSELTFIGFDEFDVESWKNCDIAFKKAVGRMRGSDNTEIYIVTSPEGYGYTYKIFVEDMNDDRYVVHGKTTDNTYLPSRYIELLESSYDQNLLKAYRDGEFVNLQEGQTYYSFNRENNIEEYKYNPNLPICIGQDWNVEPITAVLFQVYNSSPKIRIFDEIGLSHSEGEILTQKMINMIKSKYKNNMIVSYPDPSGNQRRTSSLYTDIQILKNNGFVVKVRHKAPAVIDRVNAMNKMLIDDIIIDPKCKLLIRDLEQVTNKEGTREINKTTNKDLTHFSDALGYAVEFEFPVIKPKLENIQR